MRTLILAAVMDWRPVLCVPSLSPKNSWEMLQTGNLNWIKQVLKMDGWMNE